MLAISRGARLATTLRGFEDIETELVAVDDLLVEVATPRMLYRMKRDTVRPQDHADAARLRDRFGLED